jgi:hypothetical protein
VLDVHELRDVDRRVWLIRGNESTGGPTAMSTASHHPAASGPRPARYGYFHARRRLAERYRLFLSPHNLDDLSARVERAVARWEAGRGDGGTSRDPASPGVVLLREMPHQGRDGRHLAAIDLLGRWIVGVYDEHTRVIVTVLPEAEVATWRRKIEANGEIYRS